MIDDVMYVVRRTLYAELSVLRCNVSIFGERVSIGWLLKHVFTLRNIELRTTSTPTIETPN